MLPDRLPDKPSQPPALTVPVDTLGFSAPAAFYLGEHSSWVSLDFLDESRLLFTFRVPGLILRDTGSEASGHERQIRALVLQLPAGTVESEALWTVHDRARYLWMMKDGHFLLRDWKSVERGDAALELKPYLQFSGPIVWMGTAPAGKFLVTDSNDPAKRDKDAGDLAGTALDGQNVAKSAGMVVRILNQESGKVLLMSRAPSAVHLSINADGYLESLRGKRDKWLFNLKYFGGGNKILGEVESACQPAFEFVSEQVGLVSTCNSSGGGTLVAMTTDGRRLWEARTSDLAVWPLVVKVPNGSRLAREAIILPRMPTDRVPVDATDVKGQLVEVLNVADGKVALETSASPVLDAGGNVAISPSGRRVAVLNGGQIQIFDLPAAPPIPVLAPSPALR
jgi:hypothetical protein